MSGDLMEILLEYKAVMDKVLDMKAVFSLDHVNNQSEFKKINEIIKICSYIESKNEKMLGKVFKIKKEINVTRSFINSINGIENKHRFIHVFNSCIDNEKEDETENVEIKQSPAETSIKELSGFNLPESCHLSLSRMHGSIDCIPPSVFYRESKGTGLFMRLYKNTFIELPFVDTIDIKNKKRRSEAIRCSFYKKGICNTNKNNSCGRCNYVHKGERLKKISNRKNFSFGCFKSLSKDVTNVGIDEIREMLLHSCSDLILVMMWIENNIGDNNYIFELLDRY
jgi:hypothetical protein